MKKIDDELGFENVRYFTNEFRSVEYYSKRIMYWNKKLEQLHDEMTSIKAIDTTNVPCENKKQNNMLLSFLSEEHEAILERQRWIDRISEIAIVFERLPENVQSIVVDLYILKEKHREVADKYNYSRQSLYRLVNTAIKKATEK